MNPTYILIGILVWAFLVFRFWPFSSTTPSKKHHKNHPEPAKASP
jgi:hypothetical protein